MGEDDCIAWTGLVAELDRWSESGRVACFWWRDDDAGGANPALVRLLELTGSHGITPLLAVVPEWAEPPLAALLGGAAAAVGQHGIGHRNNAAAGERKTELVDGVPGLEGALLAARDSLSRLFGRHLLPVLIPPWNRLGPQLRCRLPALGYGGLSSYRPRPVAVDDGLQVVNCHCDPVDWHGGRGFLGTAAVLAQVEGHLRDRRRGLVPATEPTGILSHHAVHDADTWHFLERLADRLSMHPAVVWQSPFSLFRRAE